MLEYLTGTVTSVQKQSVVLSMGPLGLVVQVPDGYAFTPGAASTLMGYLHWSAEQGPTIYGFTTALERSLFIAIIGCNGIGPKLALAILGTLGAAAFINAVQGADYQALSKVSGVGIKKAENVVVQLKHKMEPFLAEVATVDATASSWHEVAQVLVTLNYSRTEVNSAMNYLRSDGNIDHTFDVLLRKALAHLTKQL